MKHSKTHKATPQKHFSTSNKKKIIDDALNNDLISPYFDTLSTSLFSILTPLKKQPQYLLSPSPIKKDLFSQLLGTQTKNQSTFEEDSNSIMEEESYSDDEISSCSSMEAEEEENMSQNEGNWSDENQIKKRKRKSTAQIKLLKQELDGEMNWTKEKIMKMAQITGLSQSQVYKWCWDQKKKQTKQSNKNYLNRRRLIRKDVSYRVNLHKFEKESEEEMEDLEHHDQTKMKTSYRLEEGADTQKKIKKRLVFL